MSDHGAAGGDPESDRGGGVSESPDPETTAAPGNPKTENRTKPLNDQDSDARREAPRVALVHFPGTNRERDAEVALRMAGCTVVTVEHTATDLDGAGVVVIPGGFSYGDYLRSGVLAARTPVMDAVEALAEAGGYVLGICNGFQVLLERGMLPGGLAPNAHQRFSCRMVSVEITDTAGQGTGRTPFLSGYRCGQRLRFLEANYDGCYVIDESGMAELRERNGIVLRYAHGGNGNGSVGAVAGICNPQGNVLGLMPHPENAVSSFVQGDETSIDGRPLFRAVAALDIQKVRMRGLAA